jgi:peptidyl-tRNA hydrolase, PTH1 family
MLFVVGLGNPGLKYRGTRHNVGFAVVERLAERYRFAGFRTFKKAEVSRGQIRGTTTLLIEPMTYMNLSGDAVGSILRYYKGEPSDVIVVHDDMDFDPGQVRIKKGGGDGGHNGLSSVSQHIGREFARVRLGIGKPEGDGYDHVLSRFSSAELALVDDAVDQAADAVETVVAYGLERAMGRFNRRPKKIEHEDSESLQPGEDAESRARQQQEIKP